MVAGGRCTEAGARARPDTGTVPGNVIAYRHADPRFPFLREDSSQSAGRWNAPGELTHYFCDTPDGRLGGVPPPRGDPRPAGYPHRSPRALGRRHRRNPVASTGSASAGTDWRTGHLASMPASRSAVSPTHGRHRRALGGAQTGRGSRMARRRRSQARPRPGRAGLRTVWPAPRPHWLGRDRRRSPKPGPAPEGPAFPTG